MNQEKSKANEYSCKIKKILKNRRVDYEVTHRMNLSLHPVKKFKTDCFSSFTQEHCFNGHDMHSMEKPDNINLSYNN